jgi:imidazolonepropionase-like amidohydrolase
MKMQIIKGGKLIDGSGGSPIEKSIVVVDGSKIVFVGGDGEFPMPKRDDIEIINAEGKTIMPGLIDTHVHIYRNGGSREFRSLPIYNNDLTLAMKSVPLLKRTLEMGITTLRDGGSGWNWLEVALRDAIDRGDIVGPRFFTSGYHLTVTGGHGYFMPPWLPNIKEQSSVQCDGPEEWRKAARLQIFNGVDNVKLVASRGFLSTIRAGDVPTAAQASLEELKAAVDEAHKMGKKSSAHANGHQPIITAIEAGVDSIVHGFGMDEECAEMMVKKNVFLEATTLTIRRLMEFGSGEMPDAMVERATEYWKIKEKEFRMILKKGVKISFASDMGMPYLYHGENARELNSLVELGMTPMAAIVSATNTAAQVIGIDDQVGTIEVGKIADIILIDGDPLKNMEILQAEDKIKMVMKEGKIIINR